MAYFTETELKNFTGFSYEDFKAGGQMMNSKQWATLVDSVQDAVDKAINNFCNVPTLLTHQATEYFSGRKATGDWNDYTLADRTFYLYENCQSVATVAEDITPTSIPTWTVRYPRTDVATGDFSVYTEAGLTQIIFNNNIPYFGTKNLKVEYVAGFDDNSAEVQHIRMIALRMATNLLMKKKKVQEATTIRRAGTEDYAKMFDDADHDDLLTKKLEIELSKYKRWLIPCLSN
jgi:hypothetical protein